MFKYLLRSSRSDLTNQKNCWIDRIKILDAKSTRNQLNSINYVVFTPNCTLIDLLAERVSRWKALRGSFAAKARVRAIGAGARIAVGAGLQYQLQMTRGWRGG